MTPPLISSQRYFNKEIVARKVANFKVFVVRTIDLELRGNFVGITASPVLGNYSPLIPSYARSHATPAIPRWSAMSA